MIECDWWSEIGCINQSKSSYIDLTCVDILQERWSIHSKFWCYKTTNIALEITCPMKQMKYCEGIIINVQLVLATLMSGSDSLILRSVNICSILYSKCVSSHKYTCSVDNHTYIHGHTYVRVLLYRYDIPRKDCRSSRGSYSWWKPHRDVILVSVLLYRTKYTTQKGEKLQTPVILDKYSLSALSN